jgi:hypothetical protein
MLKIASGEKNVVRDLGHERHAHVAYSKRDKIYFANVQVCESAR